MTSHRLGIVRIGLALTLLLTGLLPGASGAAAEIAVYWLPADAPFEGLSDRLDLHYNGQTGHLVRVRTGMSVDMDAAGCRRFETGALENLYVFWLADAELAEFETPARILLRSGHEVLVETTGEAPRLSAAAEAALAGLRQPVRVSSAPLPWPELSAAPPVRTRDYDPLIQEMLNGVTTENFMVTWQTLEDFVTRYTFAAQNELATQWLLDQFLSFGLDAEFHYYEQSGQRRNVVATLPGLVDPTRVVYLVAHMDAISGTPETCAPGADDDGSGTSAVVEAARVLSQFTFEYTIKFVCFNGEEQGLVGSAAYVADIAQAGEDVIGAFNMDMIAYRGTDAAPPDIVIYTNSASQGLATTLSTACGDYLPGLLEPIIHVENMTASDHASFWNWGYQAIVACEDEAWGDDFSPWYHTCNDLIANYPQDYVLDCAKANLAALATTAVPLDPEGPYLVLSGSLADDDDIGSSNGDGDGLLNPGETVELWVTVRNVGTETAQNVSGELASTSGSVSILNSSAAWNDIPSWGEGANLSPFVFEIGGGAQDGETLPFTLMMTSDGGVQELSLQFTVVAPDLAFYFHRLDDSGTGNGDGVPEPGEVVLIPVSLANAGGKDALEVSAQLVSETPLLTVIEGTGSAATIPSGENAELAPAYRVHLSPDALEDDLLPLSLAISTAAGYEASSGFQLKVGSLFYDELEADGAWTLGAPGDDASTGLWVRVDPNGTEYNGQPCQPEDDHTVAPGTDCLVTGQGPEGGSAGAADVDGGKTTVTSPVFDLASLVDARVTYWRWYTNDLGNNPGLDEWVVQVSPDGGGSWIDLERTTASANSWLERSFLIEDYITPTSTVAFRFIASDEGDASLVEAAVDDFEISGQTQPVTSVADFQPGVLMLAQARPNPSRAGTVISFALPAAGAASLKLYSVDGRLVRTLLDGQTDAGVHEIAWDGKGDTGFRAATGVYLYQLEATGQRLTRKLVVIR